MDVPSNALYVVSLKEDWELIRTALKQGARMHIQYRQKLI